MAQIGMQTSLPIYSSLTTKRLKTPALNHYTRKQFYSGSAPCRIPIHRPLRSINIPSTMANTPNTLLTAGSTISVSSSISDVPNGMVPVSHVDYSDVVTQVTYNYGNTFTLSEVGTLPYLRIPYFQLLI